MAERAKTPPNKRARAASGAPATDGRSRSLWFDPPIDDPDRRPQLTRQRVVAEALAVIAQDGVQAMTMRSLAARLGVVPGAVYHHVGNKQQLQDLLLDGVLAEVDFHTDPSLPWTEQLKVLAHRLRQVLERHPGVAGILKTRDPLGPTPWPWPRRCWHRCGRPGSVTARPAWRSSCWSTTPSASRSAALVPPSTSSGSATRRLGPSCTSSSARCLRPLPRPGRPRRTRLARQPRRTVHRRPPGAGRGAGARTALAPPTGARGRPTTTRTS